MPGKREGPTLKDVTLQVLAELTAPASGDDIVRRVLERFPSTSKDPPKRVRDLLHSYDMVGVELVYLDPKTIAPLGLAMLGVRFRAPITPEEIKQGVLTIEPGFVPFLSNRFNRAITQDEIELRAANDQIIPTRLVTGLSPEEQFIARKAHGSASRSTWANGCAPIARKPKIV